ncbi:holo-ACP synthase [Solimicrobium silvestre]|uniref:Holo-[acyl-carrier-protein] synthase n=1 Tax=Solimicrobium silvestre TaxID=2099400 RepID=A0A2S9GY17_9BURK|nr:holo-ACP synthase [Solimicrobium silvestre]PRC92612.1 acpS: holo-[acyl-carrier-protein] synthase [Solimicrobium silvestre]
MVYGIGTDIVQISRIVATLARTGERFAEKILGAEEFLEYQQRHANVGVHGLHYLCNRYAAKEAFSKALGLGMRAPLSWHTIQILNDSNGAPYIVTSGDLAEHMQSMQLTAKISLSDEVDYSLAFVLIEKNNDAA